MDLLLEYVSNFMARLAHPMNTGYGMLIWLSAQAVGHESEIRVWMGARPAHTACYHNAHDHGSVLRRMQLGRQGKAVSTASSKPRLHRAAVQVHTARTWLVHWISRHRPQPALGGLALSSTVKLGLTAAAPKYGLHRVQAIVPPPVKHSAHNLRQHGMHSCNTHHVSSSRSPYPHLHAMPM